jgi:molybdate transport system ATP-binding protein
MTLVLQDLRVALRNWSLELSIEFDGRITGIYGASGAGKTSLLEAIAGLRRPSAGRVLFSGAVWSDASTRTHLRPGGRRVGYVPQDGALFPHLSGRHNLVYGYRESAPHAPGLTPPHVAEILEIGALLDRPVGELSGGERQRIALGRALLADSRLLLLDEPLASLDRPLRRRILPYFERIRDEFKVPMLFVSHDASELVGICDEVLVLDRGRKVALGTPAALFEESSAREYVLRTTNSNSKS